MDNSKTGNMKEYNLKIWNWDREYDVVVSIPSDLTWCVCNEGDRSVRYDIYWTIVDKSEYSDFLNNLDYPIREYEFNDKSILVMNNVRTDGGISTVSRYLMMNRIDLNDYTIVSILNNTYDIFSLTKITNILDPGDVIANTIYLRSVPDNDYVSIELDHRSLSDILIRFNSDIKILKGSVANKWWSEGMAKVMSNFNPYDPGVVTGNLNWGLGLNRETMTNISVDDLISRFINFNKQFEDEDTKK